MLWLIQSGASWVYLTRILPDLGQYLIMIPIFPSFGTTISVLGVSGQVGGGGCWARMDLVRSVRMRRIFILVIDCFVYVVEVEWWVD